MGISIKFLSYKMHNKIIEKFIKGVYVGESSQFEDKRGIFYNIFRKQNDNFKSIWGSRNINQINISKNFKAGTIRGLHLQIENNAEAKLIRCLKGKIFDVVLDLRKQSETFGKWLSVELSSIKQNYVLIPEGCAHGFQTLEKDTEIIYIHSGDWVKNAESGVKWNDPTLSIQWPMIPTEVSQKDSNLPSMKDIYEL